MFGSKLTDSLSKEDKRALLLYIEEQDERDELIQLVKRKCEGVPVIYRGTQLLKKDLLIGSLYKRHRFNDLSSWTESRMVAEGFAFTSTDFDESDDFDMPNKVDRIPVLLVCFDTEGFKVNNHLIHEDYQGEKEILCEGFWTIIEVEEKNNNGSLYMQVLVQKS